MRVLYTIDSLVPGGAERSLAAMAPHLVAKGIDLHVAHLHDRPGLQDELCRSAVPVHSLAGSGGRSGWVVRTTQLIRQLRPDVVHTTLFEADLTGRLAARLTGTPSVTSLVNMTYGAEHRADPGVGALRLWAAQALDVLTATQTARFHAVGSAVADVMSHRLRVPRERIDVVPRGRDQAALGSRSAARRAAARAGLGVADGVPLVVSVARHEHQKGLDVLIAATRLLRDDGRELRVVVAGRHGDATAGLLKQIEQLGLLDVVALLGPRSDVPELLCAADVFVLPTRREGSPGSVLEAMALEAPIVVTDLPEVREVVDPSMARLVAVDAHEALSVAVGGVLDDRAAAGAMAERGRRRFLERYTIERVSEQMVDFYHRSIGDPVRR